MLERVVGRMFRSAAGGTHRGGGETGRSTTLPEGEETAGQRDKKGGPGGGAPPALGDVEIDNSQHVLVKIATLYAERLMNDICLVVDGVEYPAHRLILCASSEVFQIMLMKPEWSESQMERVVLQESPPCAEIFGEFIRYFYTGQIWISQLSISPLLALADKYYVKDLTELCLDYMLSHIALAAKESQLITWYQYTLSLGHHRVALACQNFLKWNFEVVARTPDFLNCSHEILVRLLQMNDLVVTNEMTLYKLVVNWLEGQRQQLMSQTAGESAVGGESAESYMTALVQLVMSQVRFPMMSPRQLAELLLAPLTSHYKEFFIQRMALGMSFHSDQRQRLREVCDEEGGRALFTPRMYTSDSHCSTLCIDYFSQFPVYHTRTMVFSSHTSLAEHAAERMTDWVIDIFPKGVWFQRYYLIVWQGTVDVPELILKTVRLAITAKDLTEEYLKVKVGVLMVGETDGIEHVHTALVKNHHFNCNEPVLNLDDVIPFQDLNMNLLESSSSTAGAGSLESRPTSNYLVGPNSAFSSPLPSSVFKISSQLSVLTGDREATETNRDTLKVHIIIVPLSEFSSIEPEVNSLIIPSR